MSKAEELLNQVADTGVVAAETIPYFTIDLNSRLISVPAGIKNIGVESDDEVTRLHFKVPRYYNGIDLSEFIIRINYTNANNDGDVYSITDMVATEEEITFSWLVGRFAVTKQGTVTFVVCMIKMDGNGYVDREFNSTICTLPVLKGLETVGALVEDQPDAFQSIADEAVAKYKEEINIPTKVSDLENDAGYVTDNDLDEVTKQINEMIVEKNGNSLILKSRVGNEDFTHKITLRQTGYNHLLSMGTVTMGSYKQLDGDDVPPIYFNNIGYVGGNHGFYIPRLTLNGQTVVDIGSKWTDGTYNYYLLTVNDDGTGFFGCGYTKQSYDGYGMASTTLPTANLTHVEGATNTGTISITGGKLDQMYPSVNKSSVKVFINESEIDENMKTSADKVTIHEEYIVISYKSLIDYAKSHIGEEINFESLDGLMRVANNYCFSGGGNCVVNNTLTAIENCVVGKYHPIQAGARTATNMELYRYINGVEAINGFDFKCNTSMTNYNKYVEISSDNLSDKDTPCNRSVDTLMSDGEKQVVFTIGFFPDKTKSKDSDRMLNSSTCLWAVSDIKKSYPHTLHQKVMASGDCYSFAAYRCYIDPTLTVTNCNAVELGNTTYVFIDSHTAGMHKCKIGEKYVGRSINVLSSEGITFNSDVVDSEGLIFTSETYGTAVITLEEARIDYTGYVTDEELSEAVDSSYITFQTPTSTTVKLDDSAAVPFKELNAPDGSVVSVYGKNLLKREFNANGEDNVYLVWTNNSGTQYFGYKTEILPAGDYTVKFTCKDNANKPGFIYVNIEYIDGTRLSAAKAMIYESTNPYTANPLKLTLEKSGQIYIYDASSTNWSTGAKTTFSKMATLQIEAGAVATAYEEYKEPQIVTIPVTKMPTAYYPNTTILCSDGCSVKYSADATIAYNKLLDRIAALEASAVIEE